MLDVLFALRMLRKHAAFTVLAVLTIALGIGANTAIFSVVKAVLLNRLPFRDPSRLVNIAMGVTGDNGRTVDFTTTADFRTRSRSFENLSLYRDGQAAIVERGEPELLQGLRVGYDFFDMLGVRMQIGRSFQPEEDRPDRRYEMILTHALWQRRFGGDPHVLGRVVPLNDASFTVVGVLPRGFEPLFSNKAGPAPEVYTPLGYALDQPNACRGCQHLQLIGRLKPGVSVQQAEAELNIILRSLMSEHPSSYAHDARARIILLRDRIVGRVSSALWVLLGAVAFVLLIACANVANLLLARATGRAKEMALRAALGAERWRIIRQLLTESVLLAMAGGFFGVVLAAWGTSALAAIGPREIPRVADIKLDATVLLCALAASLFTGVLFGLAPALRASRIDLNDALKDLAKSTEGRQRQSLRNLLVIGEIALAFVLVVGAGLLGKSFLRLMNVDPGYNPHNVLTMGTYVYGKRYRQSEVELAYYDRAFTKLRATPGIESVAMVSTLVMDSFDRRGFHIQDRRYSNVSDVPFADIYSITPEYFRVMQVPLKRGRAFTDQDRTGSAPVAIVSESCARSQFPKGDAIGRHIQLGGRDDKKPWATIVGIVGDVRHYGLDRPSVMEAYIPQAQDVSFGYILVVRTSRDPRLFESAARAAFLEADKTLPVFNITPLETYLRATLADRTFTLALLALFGALALLLAAVGIYGVISYAVTLRTREVGIRMALGARREDVLRMVLGQGLKLLGAGLGLGLAISIALTRLLSSLLFEVSPTDLATSAAVMLLLSLVALLACYIPARRATSVDPTVALRYE